MCAIDPDAWAAATSTPAAAAATLPLRSVSLFAGSDDDDDDVAKAVVATLGGFCDMGGGNVTAWIRSHPKHHQVSFFAA